MDDKKNVTTAKGEYEYRTPPVSGTYGGRHHPDVFTL